MELIPTSHANKLVLKILQARFQQYINQELTDVQIGFQRGGGNRVQVAKITGLSRKQGSS